jgi:hypothetical protein
MPISPTAKTFRHALLLKTLNISYSENLSDLKSCINPILTKVTVYEIFVKLTCISKLLFIPNTKVGFWQVSLHNQSITLSSKLNQNEMSFRNENVQYLIHMNNIWPAYCAVRTVILYKIAIHTEISCYYAY